VTPAAARSSAGAGAAAAALPHWPWRQALAALLLVGATVVVFAPALEFRLVDYDDPLYVTEVPLVQRGLSAEGVRWAFTTFHAWNWHPLTWLSLMTDFELFGQDPKVLHRTNIALHTTNVVLLFLVLGWATRAWGRSFFVAGLFGLHPLHVESVAWIAERKDVLSTFFGWLAIGAYLAYVRRPSPMRYAAVFGLLAASLLAKAMLVTLPVLLLLLDVWPLGRLAWPIDAGRARPSRAAVVRWLREATPLLREKLPLFALSLASAAMAWLAQTSGSALTNFVPLLLRLLNAVLSLARYLDKAVLPIGLSAHYPYRLPIRLDETLACGIALVLFTIVAFKVGRHVPAVLVGWIWYLVSLLPVLGVFQIGTQSIADRYTYVPLVGIFVAAAWGAHAAAERLRLRREVLGVLGIAILALLAVQARAQVLVWKDSRTLFTHALAVSGPSAEVYLGLGADELASGNLEAAVEHFRAAKEFYPRTYQPSLQEGRVALRLGRAEEAERAFLEAIALAPALPDGYFSLGGLYLQTGRPREALACFERVLALRPDYPHAGALLEAARARVARPSS
jgi:hypothetical protein